MASGAGANGPLKRKIGEIYLLGDKEGYQRVSIECDLEALDIVRSYFSNLEQILNNILSEITLARQEQQAHHDDLKATMVKGFQDVNEGIDDLKKEIVAVNQHLSILGRNTSELVTIQTQMAGTMDIMVELLKDIRERLNNR